MAIGEWREHVGGGNTFLFIVQNQKMIFEINEHCTCYNVQHYMYTHFVLSHTFHTHSDGHNSCHGNMYPKGWLHNEVPWKVGILLMVVHN